MEVSEYEERVNDAYNVCRHVAVRAGPLLHASGFRGTLTINNSGSCRGRHRPRHRGEGRTRRHCHQPRIQVNRLSIEGFDGELGSTWNLEGGTSGAAKVQFIPTRYAAPTVNTPWSFGGSVSYIDPFSGLRVTVELSDVTLTVKPSPFLKLDYFLQRDLIGDNPLTEDVVEPCEEGEFSLLIRTRAAAMPPTYAW